MNMHRLGSLDFICKPLKTSELVLQNDVGFKELSPETFEDYVTAKMAGWNNTPQWQSEIEQAARVAFEDSRQTTILLILDSRIVGAVGSFIAGDTAYLRGDFVVPEFRGRGLYRKLITYREQVLSSLGVKLLTVLADQETSSPIYQKLGYAKTAEIALLSRQRSPWVSL
jgi:GNAT superfamily N-acetyltransferase